MWKKSVAKARSVKLDAVRRALAAAASTVVIVGMTLTGCGSDNNLHGLKAPAGPVNCDGKAALTAEGSTAQQNAIALFNLDWAQLCPGKQLAYNPTGSGAGREQFIARHVDWITEWNDPAIVKLNPGAKLPDTGISPVYRSDSSGTTDNFQKYLAAAAPNSWTRGTGSEFQGGVGEGAQKSAGVIQAVQSASGSIGYVEKGFADQSGLPYAQINDGSGPVALTEDAARKAIDSANFAGWGNDLELNLKSIYSTRAAGAYPLVLATYEIVCSKGYDPATSAAVRSMLTVAADNAQDGLSAAGYVPLPDKFKKRLIAAINAIR